MKNKNKKLLLAASSGGHIVELYSLKPFWKHYNRIWATYKTPQTISLLKDETVIWLKHPTNVRKITDLPYAINSFINVLILWYFMIKHNITHVISTGAAPGVSAIWTAKILFLGKIKSVFIESLTRTKDLSFSGKLNYFITDIFLVQWPQLAKKYRRVKYKGQVI